MKSKFTNETFVERGRKIHGQKYDYSLVEYVRACDKVKIICPVHGVFLQSLHVHTIMKHGCQACAYDKKRLTQDEFIARVQHVHGDRYALSKAIYVRNNKKVTLICSLHGEFRIAPDHLFNGAGCALCSNLKKGLEKTKDTDHFVTKAREMHGARYAYDKVDFHGYHAYVQIGCPVHGYFRQRAGNHLSGLGCKKCGVIKRSNEKRIGTEEFIRRAKEIHGDKYDYSRVVYRKAKNKVILICAVHGEFKITPDNHLRARNGCDLCNESKGESEIALYLDRLGVSYERQKRFHACRDKRPLPFDFYLMWHGVEYLIEFDGEHHYEKHRGLFGESIDLTRKHDGIKDRYALENGYVLIRIPYTERGKVNVCLDAYFAIR